MTASVPEEPPSRVRAPAGADVHAWWAPLDPGPARLGALAALLAPDERQRAGRFVYDRDRRAYVAARGRLREILGRYLGRAPERVHFEYGARGKPELRGDTSIQFNVSHSGAWAVIAVARGRRVGVDVEAVRPLADADLVADRWFSAREAAAYQALPVEARTEAFFACWTRKEAFIKALGDGLSYPLDAFDVPVRPGTPAALLATRDPTVSAADWSLVDVPAPSGYLAAVAVEGAGGCLLGGPGAPPALGGPDFFTLPALHS